MERVGQRQAIRAPETGGASDAGNEAEALKQELAAVREQMAQLQRREKEILATLGTAENVLEVVPAEKAEMEFISYGKIVDKDGRAPKDAPLGITTRSKGIPDTLSDLRAASLVGLQFLNANSIQGGNQEDAENKGALIMRSLPDGQIAINRCCTRTDGRSYFQQTTYLMSGKFFYRHASPVFNQLGELSLELGRGDNRERYAASPRSLNLSEHQVSTLEGLEENARYLAELLLKRGDSSVRIPKEKFADEAAFLKALGTAVETLSRTNLEAVRDLRITAGLTAHTALEGPWIQY